MPKPSADMQLRGIIFSRFATSANAVPIFQTYGLSEVRTIAGMIALCPLSAISTGAWPIV